MWFYTSSQETAVTNGHGVIIPCDPANTDYARLIKSGAVIGACVAPPPPPPTTPRISFAQLLIGLVKRGWISEEQGRGWLSGVLPAPVATVISQLPQEMRFAATARALRPTDIDPKDPLVNMLVQQQNLTPEQKQEFFVECSQL